MDEAEQNQICLDIPREYFLGILVDKHFTVIA